MMSKTHVFVCMPMDLDDYQFPTSVSVVVKEEMGKSYSVDGSQKVLRDIAIDVARTVPKICSAMPI